jgi:guanylate cyclase
VPPEEPTPDQPTAAPRLVDLDRENRILARRLRRMEDNVRRMEEFQDSTSTLLSRLVKDLEEERARSRRLLLNVLPERIIDRLGAEQVIADRHDDVTVLFADVVGFTRISSRLSPARLIADLNDLFSAFDAICDRQGIEKIKTIGDAYLVVGGLPGGALDHLTAVAEAAIGMQEAVAARDGRSAAWRIRIGVHRGPIAAGVIGTTKFLYDVWGDTVNVASRLETAAGPGEILVSKEVVAGLGDRFELEPRGVVDLKGKGPTETWVLLGRARLAAR